jgi:hypothetical protein
MSPLLQHATSALRLAAIKPARQNPQCDGGGFIDLYSGVLKGAMFEHFSKEFQLNDRQNV